MASCVGTNQNVQDLYRGFLTQDKCVCVKDVRVGLVSGAYLIKLYFIFLFFPVYDIFPVLLYIELSPLHVQNSMFSGLQCFLLYTNFLFTVLNIQILL